MLRLSINKNEYIMVGGTVKITFLESQNGQARIMIDAPKEINIARGKAIKKREKKEKELLKSTICSDIAEGTRKNQNKKKD